MYLESFVLPVPKEHQANSIKGATEMAAIWIELGALSVTEAQADDVPIGEVTSFLRSVQTKPDETAVVAFETFRDHAHRDAVNTAVHAAPCVANVMTLNHVDERRMIWGGFDVVVFV